MNKTLRIIGRIVLQLPFMIGLTFIASMVIFIRWNINFIKYGGEGITYSNDVNNKTIYDVYVKLDKIQKNENN